MSLRFYATTKIRSFSQTMLATAKKAAKLLPPFIGAILLLSAIMKAMDTASFAQLLTRYGHPSLAYLAPIIIISEALVGIWLIMGEKTRMAAITAITMVAFYTIAYTYGLIVHNVEDCGCFGGIDTLNTSPTLLYIRNAIIICTLLPTVSRNRHELHTISERNCGWLTAIAASSIISFLCGHTYKTPQINNTDNPRQKHISLHNSPLSEFIETNRDSTYLIFAFSYTCPHCMNSIANLKEYQRTRAVDRVIALALGDSVAEANFTSSFAPNFEIRNIGRNLLRLTHDFPTSYIIRNDTIIKTIAGELPAPQLLLPTPTPYTSEHSPHVLNFTEPSLKQ